MAIIYFKCIKFSEWAPSWRTWKLIRVFMLFEHMSISGVMEEITCQILVFNPVVFPSKYLYIMQNKKVVIRRRIWLICGVCNKSATPNPTLRQILIKIFSYRIGIIWCSTILLKTHVPRMFSMFEKEKKRSKHCNFVLLHSHFVNVGAN